MNIDVNSIDWEILAKQKKTLLNVINFFRDGQDIPTVNDLTGLLHLVDTLQDTASEEIGEEKIFPDTLDI